MNSVKKIYPANILFFIIAIIHFLIGMYYTTPYSHDFTSEQKIAFFSSKILAFVLINIFWQSIPFIINAFKNKDKKIINFCIYSGAYFVLNIIVLAVIFPASYIENLNEYELGLIYDGDLAEHFLTSLFIQANQLIIPKYWGPIVCNLFFFSLVFSYFINGLKENISKKFFIICLIPFCFPNVLVFNEVITRHISVVYLYVLLISFLIFNKGKEINRNGITIFFAAVCTILISLRIEYIQMIILLPLTVFLLKIFKKKQFIIYLSVLLLTIISFNIIQNHNYIHKYIYNLHNLSFKYTVYMKDNKISPFNSSEKEILKEVYPYLEDMDKVNGNSTIFNETINTSNKEIVSKSEKIMMNFLLSNWKYFIKYDFDNFIKESKYGYNILIRMSDIDKKEPNAKLPKIISFKSPMKIKIVSYMLYGTDNYEHSKFTEILYDFRISLAIFSIMILYGILRKQIIPIFTGVNFIIVFFNLLLAAPFYYYFYFYALEFIAYLYLLIIMAEEAEKLTKSNKIQPYDR